MPTEVRTIEKQWSAVVTEADPDWLRDHKLQVENTMRPKIKHDWAHRGPYPP